MDFIFEELRRSFPILTVFVSGKGLSLLMTMIMSVVAFYL